ncbi:MAG: hypothetical protein AB1Z19_00595 [Eubacteriales bacterium]
MKKTLFVIFLVLMMMLAACASADTVDTKAKDAQTTETVGTTEETADEDMAEEDIDSGEIDIVDIMEGNVFLAMDKNLYFKSEVSSEGEKAIISTYLTPDMMRIDTAPGTSENTVTVYDFGTGQTFIYVPSEGFGATMSDVELFEDFDYQTEMMEYTDDIVNVERTTLGDWDVIYGEAEVDGGHIKFWYSEEYAMMMKYEVVTPEGEEMYFIITEIEMPDTVDAAIFEKPDDIMFYDLDESSESLIDQFLGD